MESDLTVTLTGRDFLISKRAIAATALSPSRVLGGSDRIQGGFIGYELIGCQHVHEFKNQRDVDCDVGNDVSVEKPKTLFVREGCWRATACPGTHLVPISA